MLPSSTQSNRGDWPYCLPRPSGGIGDLIRYHRFWAVEFSIATTSDVVCKEGNYINTKITEKPDAMLLSPSAFPSSLDSRCRFMIDPHA